MNNILKPLRALALLAGLGLAATGCGTQSDDAANNTNETAGETAPGMNTGDTTNLHMDTTRQDSGFGGTGTGTTGTGTGTGGTGTGGTGTGGTGSGAGGTGTGSGAGSRPSGGGGTPAGGSGR